MASPSASPSPLYNNKILRLMFKSFCKRADSVGNISGPAFSNNTINVQNPDLCGYQRRVIAKWLSSVDYIPIHNDVFAMRVEGTGDWLLNSTEFVNWRDAPNNATLWCPGRPGVGKTVLASVVVNHLQNWDDGRVAVGFIYLNYKRQLDQSGPSILASLLRQLFENRPEAHDIIESLYERHAQKRTRPTHPEVEVALRAAIAKCYKPYIVLDALDEWLQDYSQEAVRKLLGKLLSLGEKVKLLITSRLLSGMETVFKDMEAKKLEINSMDDDMRRYVKDRIAKQHAFAARLKGDLAEVLVEKVVETSNSCFLLAQLHMDSLSRLILPKAIRNAVNSLSGKIDCAYAQVLQRIDEQDDDRQLLARRMLSWVAYSFRQLSISELLHALAISQGQKELDEETMYDEDTLTSVCAGLVVIDAESGIVRFVHYTTQQFFDMVRESQFPDTHADITRTCLACLSLEALPNKPFLDYANFRTILQSYRLLDYAAKHWGYHLARSNGNVAQDALAFLHDDPKISFACQLLLRASPYRDGDYGSGVHICAAFGLVEVLANLLDNGADVNEPTVVKLRTPLSLAAQRGHVSLVAMLLQRQGIYADSPDKDGRTPLSFAAESGRESIVVMLLQREDVYADSQDDRRQTPLSMAARFGHRSIAEILLQRSDVNADSKDEDHKTPLALAAQNGQESIVALLLQRKDVDADSRAAFGLSPLMYAAIRGHVPVVTLLLQKDDVDPDSRDWNNRTPISFAAEQGRESIAAMLLKRKDVKADSKDNRGQTPLSFAAESGRESVVALLLQRDDVNPDSKSVFGKTPLAYATERGHKSIVAMLLKRKGGDCNDVTHEMNFPTMHGNTAQR